MENTLNDITNHALHFFADLVPRNGNITTKEYAKLIRTSSAAENNKIASVAAAEFEKIDGLIVRNWRGSTFTPLTEKNKNEIFVRNAGWTVVMSDTAHGYQIAGTENTSGALPEIYVVEDDAWNAGVEKLDLHPPVEYDYFDEKTNAVFDVMQQLVESPGFILTSYKNDFYKHDRNQLQNTGAFGNYLWVVRESGTCLAQLGVYKENGDFIRAALNVDRACESYIVNADNATVTPVTRENALALLDQVKYEMDGTRIYDEKKNLVADLSVQLSSHANGRMPGGVVTIFPAKEGREFSLRELLALRDMANFAVSKKAQSFFVPTDEITVGAENVALTDLIARARAQERPHDGELFTYYGECHAKENDRAFLESMGLKLGGWIAGKEAFRAEASAKAFEAMRPFENSFKMDVGVPLPHSLKPPGSIFKVVPFSHFTDRQLTSYAFCLSNKEKELSAQPVKDDGQLATCLSIDQELMGICAERDLRRSKIKLASPDAAIDYDSPSP